MGSICINTATVISDILAFLVCEKRVPMCEFMPNDESPSMLNCNTGFWKWIALGGRKHFTNGFGILINHENQFQKRCK